MTIQKVHWASSQCLRFLRLERNLKAVLELPFFWRMSRGRHSNVHVVLNLTRRYLIPTISKHLPLKIQFWLFKMSLGNYNRHSGLLTASHVVFSPLSSCLQRKTKPFLEALLHCRLARAIQFYLISAKNKHIHLSNSSPNPYLPSVLDGHSFQTKLDLQSPLAHRSNPDFPVQCCAFT